MTTHKQPPPSIFLRQWRFAMGWTQDEAAEALGVCKRTYGGYELGAKVRPSVIVHAKTIAKEKGK